MKTENISMITKSQLKLERGWTDKLIKDFLPVPDMTKPNPQYKSGSPMLLFSIERIENVEKTEEFNTQQKIASKRKEASTKAVETKRQQLRNWLDTVEIYIPILDKSKLIKLACNQYNEMQMEREFEGLSTCGIKATKESDTKFLERICVNYLRHCLTKYEEHLEEMSGKVGCGEGYGEIRSKIFSKISKKYPWLADECNRQNYDLS